jgi:hypothetical protein
LVYVTIMCPVLIDHTNNLFELVVSSASAINFLQLRIIFLKNSFLQQDNYEMLLTISTSSDLFLIQLTGSLAGLVVHGQLNSYSGCFLVAAFIPWCRGTNHH